MINLRILVFYVTTLIVLLVPGRAEATNHQRNVTVTLNVGDTILRVKGRTLPGAFVTIQDGGVTIGTATANGSGNFDKSFPAQNPGLHTLKIFAEDLASNIRTDTVTQTVSMQPMARTTVNFFLPTTLVFEDDQVIQGKDVVIYGRTIPNGNVTVRLDEKINYTTASDGNGNGNWSLPINTADFVIGVHTVFAVVNDSNGNQSSATTLKNFNILPAGASVPEESVSDGPDAGLDSEKDNGNNDQDEGGIGDFFKPLMPVNEGGLNPSGVAFVFAIITFTLAGILVFRPEIMTWLISKFKR